MLVPTLLTLDVFWTKDGLKILELQHGRRSGSKGYTVLHGLSLWETIADPFIEELKLQGWQWEKCPDAYARLLSDTGEADIARYIDGHHSLDLVLTNKAFQSALLPGLKSVFPAERIFTYYRDFKTVTRNIRDVFHGHDEIVIKAPAQAMGNGIVPIKTEDLDGFSITNWDSPDPFESSIFEPAFTVQERVKPLSVAIDGETYFPPIRLWMALVPDGDRLRPEFFNSGTYPAPIYYKLPAPQGQGSYRSQIISDIHSGKGVAPVPEHIQQKIYLSLAKKLPLALETLMNTNMKQVAEKILAVEDEGAAILAFHFLRKNEHILGHNFEGCDVLLNHVSRIFSSRYLQDENFRHAVDRYLSVDPFQATLFLPAHVRSEPQESVFDALTETWERATQNEFLDKLTQAGLCLPPEQIGRGFIRRDNDPGSYSIKRCALI